jgi:hypothetical protein
MLQLMRKHDSPELLWLIVIRPRGLGALTAVGLLPIALKILVLSRLSL